MQGPGDLNQNEVDSVWAQKRKLSMEDFEAGDHSAPCLQLIDYNFHRCVILSVDSLHHQAFILLQLRMTTVLYKPFVLLLE